MNEQRIHNRIHKRESLLQRHLSGIESPKDVKNLKPAQLRALCTEIREFMTDRISETGGHFASSLGVVELTVALHYLFSSPNDKIVWDVGHQCYPHKILTGRRDLFSKLRTFGGISGFPKTRESPHDHFDVGHASTSLSAAAGIAAARDLGNKQHHVIAIIGDGALTGGMALEALNHIGYLQKRIIIILNDNKMSISENVGALSKYTSRVTKTKLYRDVKRQLDRITRLTGKDDAVTDLNRSLKKAASPNFLFEKLGIDYLGPIDGHDIKQLLTALRKAKQSKGPILLHVKTTKGKGVGYAEGDATLFHGVGRFDKTNGEIVKCNGCSYTDVFGETLLRMAREDDRIVAITAAMCGGTGLTQFQREFPDRFFDVGIAEQHAVTLAAGLASQGMIPIVAVYSTFLQRAYDQIVHDVALQNLPVIFAIDRAGLVGEDGPTHHGSFDLSYLRHIPNLMLAAPKDKNELIQMLYRSTALKGPIAIRYPRGGNSEEHLDFEKKPMDLPSSELLIPGKHLVIVALGSMVSPALKAARAINARRPGSVGLINARFVKPLDPRILRYISKRGKALIVEENAVCGGFGSGIAEALAGSSVTLRLLGLPDRFITHGTRGTLLKEARLSPEDIEREARSLLL